MDLGAELELERRCRAQRWQARRLATLVHHTFWGTLGHCSAQRTHQHRGGQLLSSVTQQQDCSVAMEHAQQTQGLFAPLFDGAHVPSWCAPSLRASGCLGLCAESFSRRLGWCVESSRAAACLGVKIHSLYTTV